MSASIIDSNYFRAMLGAAAKRATFSDVARLESWLAVEVALARAQVRVGWPRWGGRAPLAAVATVDRLHQDAKAFDRVWFPILSFVK